MLLFTDESKFGQKMLEKFGWQKGHGLGANEDGMTETIKVQTRMDNRGRTNKYKLKWVNKIFTIIIGLFI